MVRGLKFQKKLEEFFVKYPESEPVQLNDDFRIAVEEICDELSFLEISYTNLNSESQMLIILEYLSKIMVHFEKADILEPLNNINFILYMEFSKLIINIKRLFVSEVIDECGIINCNTMFDCKKEQYICNTYKSKLEVFKSNYNEEEAQIINNGFTNFLCEFVKLLLKLNSTIPLKNNINLLLEVADLKILLDNFHFISPLISETTKISVLEKITNFCIKKSLNIQEFKFVKHCDIVFKLEMCTISYFTLQHICKYLELQNLHQTSQILASFKIEKIISLVESYEPNSEFKQIHEESARHILFKTYKKIKAVPSHKIYKCLTILRVLLDDSLDNYELQNYPFTIVLLSMLSEFVMATNLDKPNILSLISLINGYLDLNINQFFSNFAAVSYAFKIYQKLKFDYDIKIMSISLFKRLSRNFGKYKQNQNIKDDMERVLNAEGSSVDKCIIISYFLDGFDEDEYMAEDKILNNFLYTLNEQVILSSQDKSMNGQLVFPYTMLLHISIINQNEDCLYNNLAILDDYLTIIFENNKTIQLDEKKYFLTTILQYYSYTAQCLPNEFLINCWKHFLSPHYIDLSISKTLLKLCSSKDFTKFIEILKNEMIKIIEAKEPIASEIYYMQIQQLWTIMLNMQFINKKKKIRKDSVNHFCFVLNRTFVFNSKKVQTDQGLMFLFKLVCSLLKLSWINKVTLMHCSLNVITFVEKRSSMTDIDVLTDAAELLIVLYKCPNNSIKPFLGLYVITFVNLLKKCWSYLKTIQTPLKQCGTYYCRPLHKLEKCSSLFKQNKSDFDIICRYIVEDSVKLIALETHLPDLYMRHLHLIIFNLMDVCSPEEMKRLIINIEGPALLTLKNAYKDYRSHMRFTGRL